MSQPIYLDNNTTTQPSEAAVQAMLPFLRDNYGVPSAPHRMGQNLHPIMEKAYRSLYQLMDAPETDSVILTANGAEAVNHVMQSVYHQVTRESGQNHFLTSSIDEAPAIMAIGRLEQWGCVGKMAKVNEDGVVTAKAIAESITPRTALVSLSWANGLTGVVQPVNEIAEVCRQRGILLHLDATHVLGKLYFELEETEADFVTFNGDNIHAPKGTGALYARKGARLAPFILGGSEQSGLRAGSLNVAGLVGLGVAADEAMESRDMIGLETARLRDQLEERICAAYPEAQVLFQESERLPTTTAILFPGVTNDALLFALDQQGIYASFGGGSFQRMALVLEASEVDPVLANCALSFSLSRETTEEEVERAAQVIGETATRLRKSSAHLIPEKKELR